MAEISATQIDIGQYSEQKKLGLATFVKLNGLPFYSLKEYDRTGKAVVVNAAIDREALVKVVAQQEQQILNIQAVIASAKEAIADIDTAPEVIPGA